MKRSDENLGGAAVLAFRSSPSCGGPCGTIRCGAVQYSRPGILCGETCGTIRRGAALQQTRYCMYPRLFGQASSVVPQHARLVTRRAGFA